MRAREFITEGTAAGRTGTITRDVGLALPGAFKIPKLQNNDPPFDGPSSVFGEDMVIVSYDPHVKDYIDDALHSMHMPSSDAVQIGTMASEEAPDVIKVSPVRGFRGYPR